MLALRFTQAARGSRLSYPKRVSASRDCCRQWSRPRPSRSESRRSPFSHCSIGGPIMSVTSSLERCVISTTVFATTYMTVGPAFAAGSNMPWEQPLNQILQSVEGPVAKSIAVIIIIVTGLSLAFGDTSGGFRRLIQIVFGLSIAFAASSFFLSFFSFGGGVVI